MDISEHIDNTQHRKMREKYAVLWAKLLNFEGISDYERTRSKTRTT